MFKFLHAADVHLDSPLVGLDSYEGAPVDAIRGATRKALDNLVKLAIDERVAFVILAGDIYDGDWRDASTGLFFIGRMKKLQDANIPVVLIAGNHDAQSRITSSLPLPSNVRMLPTDQPDSILLDDHHVAIHGQGFANQAELQNLAIRYPYARPGYFNIGVLHTSLNGREGHDHYAPCTVEDLNHRGYDYWALGHIHTRESVNGENHPRIEYPGNIQGRHIREAGAKGGLIVEVDANHRATPQFHELDVFRWERLAINASQTENVDDLRSEVAGAVSETREALEGRPLAVRIEVTLHPDIHAKLSRDPEQFRSELRAMADHDVWIEKVRLIRHADPNSSSIELEGDARAELLEAVQELRSNSEANPLHIGECGKLTRILPSSIKNVLDEQQAEIWERATALLLAAGNEGSP